MITRIGGPDVAADTTLNLPQIRGGKKLVYTHIKLPLTAISDFEKVGEKEDALPNFTLSWKKATVCGVRKLKNIYWSIFNPYSSSKFRSPVFIVF